MDPENAEKSFEEGALDRATSDGGVIDLTWGWIELHWLDLMAGVPSIALTIFLVEFIKEPAKLALAYKLGDSYTERIENVMVRSLSLPAAALWSSVLDFRRSWNAMTGWELSSWQGLLVGTFMTAGVTWLVVWIFDYFQVADTMRVRFQRLSGVTKQDIKEAKTLKK